MREGRCTLQRRLACDRHRWAPTSAFRRATDRMLDAIGNFASTCQVAIAQITMYPGGRVRRAADRGGRARVLRAQGRGLRRSSVSALPRVGPAGSLQPLADILKLVVQGGAAAEGGRHAASFYAGADASRRPRRSRRSRWCRSADRRRSSACSISRCTLQATDVNVAVLVIFAITSMGVYGIVLAGWSSNSEVRAARRPALVGADDVSYELSYGLSLAAVLILGNSLSLTRDRQPAGAATGGSAWFRSRSGSCSCSRSASSSS